MHKTLSYYENNAKYLTQRYESAKVDNIHSLLLNTFPAKSYLLEIGCGSGRDAGFMHRNGYDVLAIDGSREMIAEAKRCHPELEGSLEVMKIPNELHFESSSFDGVYCIATLMHLDKSAIDQTIEKVAMILKAGSKFLFSVSVQRDDVDDQGKDEKGRHFTS
ncbi:MAG: methyltransferase domain-containing protein, partial [Sulfurovum sp.]|nr:methyltransferase domain-containing protein [Sulfurovum sp.]